MYSKEENEILHRIQKVEFEMFRYIDNICTTHGIKYYLWGGSLLGAIRHNNFIPWDDDFDIVMHRSDYNRFKQVIEVEGVDNRFSFSSPEDDAFFTVFIPILSYKNSSLGAKKLPVEKLNQIHLDIFILDNTSNIRLLRTLHGLSLRFIYGLALGSREESGFSDRYQYSGIQVILAKSLAFIGKFIPYKWVLCLHNTMAQIYNNKDTEYVMCTNNAPTCLSEKHSHPKNIYQSTLRCPFRDVTAPIPIGYDVIMKSGYGNYMILPPEEKRTTAHADLKSASVDGVSFVDLQSSNE